MAKEASDCEVFIADGEVWFPDGHEFCKKHGIVSVQRLDEDVWLGIEGRGEVQLSDFLAELGKARPALSIVKE